MQAALATAVKKIVQTGKLSEGGVTGAPSVTMKGIAMENYFGIQSCLRVLVSQMRGDHGSHL
jgi:hypothetical protein